ATLFITTVPRDNAALPPAIRLETDAGCSPGRDRILSELNTLINVVETHSGKPAILLVSRQFEQEYGISRDIDRTFWVTGDFFPPAYVARPWVMWSANHARHLDGIEGGVEWAVVKP
ncbi:MAG: glycoside hydrolase family 25, partial [Sphingobium sp.]